ncbi:MAG: DUF445 domain-containing protein [Solirubrobacterales bacterium]
MAVAATDSKEVTAPKPGALDEAAWAVRARDRAAELRRMRLIATGLLVLMLVVFLAAGHYAERWPLLSYVRAFAEAGMVGACADWFAVVALFRRPLGLPIPHTAIVPRNKERIGESLGAFICNNFLAPEVVAAKLDSLDVAGRLARWLAEPANAATVAKRAAGVLPPVLEALEEDHVRAFVHGAIHRGVDSVEAAPLLSRVLAVMVAHGHHQRLFDRMVEGAGHFLIRNEPLIRAKVADRSWRWLPRWVDEKLADKVMVGLFETFAELRDPAHPWRGEFQALVEDYVGKLAADPEFRARGEAIKAEVMRNPVVEEYLDSVWTEIKGRLKADIAADDGVLRLGIERAVLAMAGRLDADPRMQAILNRWARRVVERTVIPNRGQIGSFISGVVARWDTRTLVDKLELQVGRDLQYIRINGTVVGGLVGLLIHALSHALGWAVP